MTSPSRRWPSTSFTSSSGNDSVRSVTSPRPCSWRTSQRSIQLPTRLPATTVSPATKPDRRMRDRAAVPDDRVEAEPREHLHARRRGSRRCRRSRARRRRRAPFVSSRTAAATSSCSPSTSSAPSSRASVRRRSSVSIATTGAASEHADELERDVADAADADDRRGGAGLEPREELLHGVVRGDACVRVRCDVDRLDARAAA